MTTAYITHAQCLLHEMTEDHPESPRRLWAINDALIQARVERSGRALTVAAEELARLIRLEVDART